MSITHPKNNINENQKHLHFLLIMNYLLQKKILISFFSLEFLLEFLFWVLKKLNQDLGLNGVGIQFFKPIGDRHIVNGMKLPPVP